MNKKMGIRAKTNLVILTALFFGMMPDLSRADHECIEHIDDGCKIVATKRFPAEWFLIGGNSISDKAFHSELRKRFRQNYSESFDEGYTGFFCARKNGVHLSISNGGFGAWAEFSTLPAKCRKCNNTSAGIGYLVSGTGLAIGMSRKEISHIIGYKIEAEITSIKFEELERTPKHRIQHSQTLRLVFQKDKLVEFSIYENREVYDEKAVSTDAADSLRPRLIRTLCAAL